MKLHSLSLTVVIVASGLTSLAPFRALADDGLSKSEFLELHRELRPDETEPWRTIPWKISLLDAQRLAASEGKPLFIWAMDGHPLGCT